MSEELKAEIGQRVRAARKRKGYTKEALCDDESHLSVRQLTRIETGKSLLSIDKGLFIASRLGVSIQEFIEPDKMALPQSYVSLKRRIIQFKSYEDPERLKQLDELIDELQTYYDSVPEEEQIAIEIIQAKLDVFMTRKTAFAEPLIEEYFHQLLLKEDYTWNDYLLISLYLVLCTLGIENKRYFNHFVPSIFTKGDLSDPDIAYQMEEVVLAVLTQENVAYYPDCIDTLNRVIKVTKHYQNKPILEMFKAKLALFQGDIEQMESNYRTAFFIAESLDEPILLERLKMEYDKDKRLV
ncbi:helix-turn-helix domain-containing protein [Streptococcus hyovaginalis]|uniref:helix-turn-helix domain-containing protein n=1 Tax=Streptococcus hyovaginalis TaxID=149015 RepID=UPI003AE0AA84